MSQPRQDDVVTAAVKNLWRNDALAAEIYQDTSVPADPTDRDRIFDGHPATKRDDKVLIGVEAVSVGSVSPKATIFYNAHRLQVTIEYSASYFERRGASSMRHARALCMETLEGGAPRQYPGGVEGGSTIETVENDYRQIVADFRMTTIHGCG